MTTSALGNDTLAVIQPKVEAMCVTIHSQLSKVCVKVAT